ncbi:hypothetical protein [Marinomonas transparens]|uniref:Uncharacterized protein n=1 Tax=Marinomonas transparens TaxID=2795388 RepID=A0A934JWZ3_9GAMM|nr:hypothetical protein [Marinomonas transparens]MBJ7539747.1 hypothetical protein [Marinomonas transparens]
MINDYPYRRVIIGFTLCPGLAGLLSGSVMLAEGMVSEDVNNVFELTRMILLIPLITGVGGFVMFCIPALAASIIYTMLHLFKSWRSYFFITLVGGCVACLWSLIVFGSHVDVQSTGPYLAFALGAVSSLLMAYLVLPKKPKKY